ncbi:MAG: nickel pincer cofactor biosynthesis protein LarB [Paracoccus sp. (in: a-proteobacteria)]
MEIKTILELLQDNKISIDEVQNYIQGYKDIGFAKLDTDRKNRTNYYEVIYGEGKSVNQLVSIVDSLKSTPILITRLNQEKANSLLKLYPQGNYYKPSRCFTMNKDLTQGVGNITIVTAGTSDSSVAEEASIVAEFFGNSVTKIYDVGVAGIHRLLDKIDLIRQANVIIVIAGMEGALVSVVSGLVDIPVIAVPTSIGYGTNLNGITALFSMLNSCSSGVSVVNIDNGFGAAFNASMINKKSKESADE